MVITFGDLVASANVATRATSSGVKWIPQPDTVGEDVSDDVLAFFVCGSDDMLMCWERRTANARTKPKVVNFSDFSGIKCRGVRMRGARMRGWPGIRSSILSS